MTKRSLASLILKLMAVYVMVRLIPSLPIFLSQLFSIQTASRLWVAVAALGLSFLLPAVWLIGAFIFLKCSDRIAAYLVGDDEDLCKIGEAKTDEIYAIVFVCLGLSLVVGALPQIVQIGSQFIYTVASRTGRPIDRIAFSTMGKVLCFITQLLLGVFLMIRPRVVLAVIQKYGEKKGGGSSES